MAQIQNHGGGGRLYVAGANALTKDKAVSRVAVQVDTSRWSKRKRNIITESLRTGVAACGRETAEIVYELGRSIGRSVNMISCWNTTVFPDEVKPERLEELLAYTSAWLRMREEKTRPYYKSFEDRALEAIERGEAPNRIPIDPSMSYDEMREFIHEYLKASDERENAQLQRLIGEIEQGVTITVEITK